MKFISIPHILATLYTKVSEKGNPPTNWSKSNIKLIYKKGETADPGNFRMIALTDAIGKTYHLILGKRMTNYILSNNLIDRKLQKALLPGIYGCTEHNLVMDEVVIQAKQRRKTVHITYYDLEGAFGCVPHNLVYHALERNFFPEQLIEYFKTLYNNTNSKVVTQKYETNPFQFKAGLFKGDPTSPILFLIVFNPIIQYLGCQKEMGFDLNGEKVIALPYADDFCTMTTHKMKHQKLMNIINNLIETMGMKLKSSSKCRTFSIQSGTPKSLHFQIKETTIPTIKKEEQKFFGRVLFFDDKSSDTFGFISECLKKKINNLDATHIQNQYKLWIYQKYLMSPIRFILAIHDIVKTDLVRLTNQTNKILKQWAEFPRCASNSIFHHPNAVDIPSISDIYHQTHTMDYVHTTLKGDELVNHSLEAKVEREGQFTRTTYGTLKAKEIFDKAHQQCSSLINKTVQKHIKSVHVKEKHLKCNNCDFYFVSAENLELHVIAVHEKMRTYQCEGCEYKSDKQEHFESHIKSVHGKEKHLKCGTCDFYFVSAENLESHIVAVHEKMRTYQCESCKYRSDKQEHFESHIKSVYAKENISNAIMVTSTLFQQKMWSHI